MLMRLEKDKIPIGQIGSCALEVQVPDPGKPLPLDMPTLLSVKAAVKTGDKWSWGGDASAKLGLDAQTHCSLAVLSVKTADVHKDAIKRYGLSDFVTKGGPVLLLEVGADAGLSASGSFRYGVLKTGVTLKAGAEGSAGWARPFDPLAPSLHVLENFFTGLALPADMAVAPAPGEVTVFEYSGDLKLGASVGAGFEAKGSSSVDIGDLHLTENFKGAAIGKLAVSASVSGRFAVEVRAPEARNGVPVKGWARVVVRRSRSKTLSAAAGVSVEASLKTDGLPGDPKAFFGALLGVAVGNWLNLADQILGKLDGVTDLSSLETKLDGLAKAYVEAWLGKKIPELVGPAGLEAFAKIQEVVKAYQNAEPDALALFDRYFEPEAKKVLDCLAAIQKATSWEQFQGQVDPMAWDVVERLTGGDPLGAMIGGLSDVTDTPLPTLAELQAKAQKTADAIRDLAHGEISRYIQLAKKEFGLDPLMAKLDEVDSPEKLAALAGTSAGHLVARLTGTMLDSTLTKRQLNDLFRGLQKIQAAWKGAGDTIRKLLEEAANIDLKLELAAGYARTDERDALVDAEFNLADATGRACFRKAVLGGFAGLLAESLPTPGVWRLNAGAFTRKLLRKRTFQVAVLGWHEGFHYQAMSQVLTQCTQRVLPAEGGTLIVNTTLTAISEQDAKRQDEERHAKFALALAAVSHAGAGGSGFDTQTQQFLVETATAKSAAYALRFVDGDTRPDELKDYLAFAQSAGLGSADALFDTLVPMIRPQGEGFGKVAADYNVKFTKEALAGVFARPITESELHGILGPIVLGRFAGDPSIAPAGWAFFMKAGLERFKLDGLNLATQQGLDIRAASFPAPPSFVPPKMPLVLSQYHVRDLVVLYTMERDLFKAWTALVKLVGSTAPKQPSEIQTALDKFLRACSKLQWFSGERNLLFAFFDGLARLMSPGTKEMASTLAVSFTATDGTPREVRFVQAR